MYKKYSYDKLEIIDVSGKKDIKQIKKDFGNFDYKIEDIKPHENKKRASILGE
jgi:hypothetical protein